MAVAIKGIVDQNGVTHRFDHEYLENNPPIPAVDDTLSTTGSAADAKATGDAISSLMEDLQKKADSVVNAKMLGVGSNLMTGSVWTSGEFDHLADVENRPYSIVAKALNILDDNVLYKLMSSAGIIYDSGNGNLVSRIKETDITSYDVIFTQMHYLDLEYFSLGSVASTANDGTVCGAIKDLMTYIRTNNSNCRLIIVGAPPVVYTTGNPFERLYGNYTMKYADSILHELAESENFVYIDWQGCDLMYHYHDHTDVHNIHANNEDTYRCMGEYLATRLCATPSYIVKTVDDMGADIESNVSNIAAILNDAVLDVTWVNKTINPNTAELTTTTSASRASTLYKIPVPKGAKMRIKTGYDVRIVKYKNGEFTIADSTNRWVDVSSSEADYVRYQVATSIANATSYVEISVVMDNGNVAHTDNVAEGINKYNASGKITKTGNPITMQNTAEASLDSISLSSVDSGEELIVCNKNLFKMYPANVVVSGNNTRFELDRENGIIHAIASTGTTADQPSAGESTFPSDYLTLNGKNWVHNFHFRFNVDTVVTITDNCSVYQPFDYLCKLQISDGTTLWNVSDAGVTIMAKADVMYGVRVMAHTGWQGDITFKPQIEISKNATSYEAHKGFKLSAVASDGSANVFDLVNYSKIAQSHDSGKLKITFNPIDDTLDVVANGISSNLKVYSNEYTDGVNGVAYDYIWKGVIGELPVFMRCIPKELVGVATAVISNGTKTWTDSGDGVWLDAVANTEYAMRINLNAGATFSYTFKPIIATGIEAYKLGGSQCPITNIYTNGDCSITATAKRITAKEQSERANEITDHIISVTGGRFPGTYTRKLPRRPMVVFIDDDTSSVSLVTRYHDIFTAKSVVGNYAVMTKNLDDNPGLPELLLDYEEQGFGCLYHCYYQSGSATNYFLESERDMEQVRENFYRGLRSIQQYGFQNYKHWVTPYGVNDKDIRNLAKEAGMESLIKMSLTMTSGEILTPYGQLDRWNVPRITISAASSVAKYESLVDACVQNNGWLLCVTHVNTWNNTTMMDTKLSDAIQYALTAGASVVSYPEAFEDFRALFYLNELN